MGIRIARSFPITSPRLRGEVGICATRKFRVRGAIRESASVETPLTPTLSPQERGEGEATSVPRPLFATLHDTL